MGGATALVVALVTALVVLAPAAEATAGDIGHLDQSFSGVSNPPTSDKPQSKLWFNDGLWWATMFDTGSQDWHIFRLNRSTEQWVDTKTPVDTRVTSLSDALWDGSKLYIGSQYASVTTDYSIKTSVSGRPARLYRYSYNSSTKTYSLDSGFPKNINNYSSESLTIDKDTTGRVWATWTQVSGSSTAGYMSAVYVNSSADGGTTWGTPMVVPASGANANVGPDDISAVVAYGKSGPSGATIGVLWSNHLDDSVYWATHKDGDPVGTWKGSVAVRGTKQADDHLNLKTIQADAQGRVFAAVKTSLDELSGSSSSSPQIQLLVFKPGTASWSATTFGTIGDCHSRPQVMLDEQNGKVHVFATAPTASGCDYSGAPGTIYEKVAPIDNPVFPSGRGTPIIRDAASANMNNPTSMKQSINSQTGMVVLASNWSTKRYWHADISLGTGITRAATSTAVATTAANGVTVAAPQGSAGDVLVSCLSLNGGSVSTVPSGWTRIAAVTAISNPHVYGYYKVAGSSEPTSYRWGYGSTIVSSAGIARYTGAAGLDGTPSTASGASASTGTVPGVTTTSANDMLVGCMGINSGSTSISIGSPSGMTQAWDLGGKRQELDDELRPTTGATGSRSWTFSSGREWAGWLTALRPQ